LEDEARDLRKRAFHGNWDRHAGIDSY
jgi:hypothetical protein